MSTSPCPLPHSLLGLGDLGGLQILVGPGDTKEKNWSLGLGEVGDQGMGQGTGHNAEAGMWWDAPLSCRIPPPALFRLPFPCLSY